MGGAPDPDALRLDPAAPWNSSFPWLVSAAGYISLISIVLFVVALVMLVRGGSFGRGQKSTPNRWRGQVIEMPGRGAPLVPAQWWQRLRARFSAAAAPPAPAGGTPSSGSRPC